MISSTKLRYHIFISLRLRREGLGCDLSSLANSTSIPVGSCSRRLFLDWASYLVANPSCILAHVLADESLCQLTLCEKRVSAPTTLISEPPPLSRDSSFNLHLKHSAGGILSFSLLTTLRDYDYKSATP